MSTTLTDQQLLECNDQGLIPGPGEDDAAFLRRVESCLSLKDSIVTELKDHIPFVNDDLGSATIMDQAYERTRQLYAIAPSWIPVFFSNYQLMPWHGGCAWIFQTSSDSPKMAFFQLRRHFAVNDTYLKMYHRDDLIAHELAHVGRMAFEEPQYEEILAYRSAPTGYRRWLGPLLQSSHEALILLGLFFICLIVDAFAIVSAKPHILVTALWWKLLPIGYLIYLIGRLAWRHRRFSLCRQRLRELTGDDACADAIIYRLTDSEINCFGTLSSEQIMVYAQEQAKLTPRWRLIALLGRFAGA